MERRHPARHGAEPRTFAELPLGDAGHVEVSVWANRQGQMCLAAMQFDSDDSGSGGRPFGPCNPEEPCSLVCVDQEGDAGVVAIVPLDGDLITITLADGERRGYPLTGAQVPGFARRAFIVDLEDATYRAIDVTAGGVLVAHEEKSPKLVAYEVCYRSAGDPGIDSTDAELQAYGDRINACVAARTGDPSEGSIELNTP